MGLHFFPEDCDALWALGIAATTNHGGAKKWKPELDQYLKGAKVIILPDNDEAGRGHAKTVHGGLQPIAESDLSARPAFASARLWPR
jgi:putative DNA primase/helicase